MNFQSGYQNFERHAGGFRPGELTVLAVPPAMGATAFCLGMMDAPNGKGDILYLSLSATTEQMVLRMKTTGIQCRPERLNPDLLSIDHRDREHYILHCGLPSTLDLLEAIAKACAYRRPGLIIIDGLCFIGRQRKHIFDPSGAHHRTLRQLKMMAVTLQRPILLVATIKNDRAERRGPLLGADAIHEPHVDNFMVMQRYDYYDLHTDDLDEPVLPGDTDIHLLKCKWGLTASFRLRLSNTTWLMEEIENLGL